jgi:1-deoxy-D-xylulose-5-phosphate reductoisomerase
MKVISLLGSTGSIGTNTLRVTSSYPRAFRIAGLSGNRNIPVLADQVEQVLPEIVSCGDENGSAELQSILRRRGYPLAKTRFVSGVQGNIALANKETLVMAGQLMMRTAEEKGVEILPVDSEHNAIHQCLRGGVRKEVRRLILTASGGPFRKTPKNRLQHVTREEALNHPTWQMGRKITIDSATLMNKGLEVIEASWLFGVPADEIDVIVHPQSIIHSMVEFVDGSVLAQLGLTDMRIPIQYALTYPERWDSPLPALDFHKLPLLEFHPPDEDKFRCLALAYRAVKSGGTAPAVLNAANEVVVDAFLSNSVAFNDIPSIIESVLSAHTPVEASSLDAVIKADAWARAKAGELAKIRAKVGSRK